MMWETVKVTVILVFAVVLSATMWIMGDLLVYAKVSLRASVAACELDMIQQRPDSYIDRRKKELVEIRDKNSRIADEMREGFSYRTAMYLQHFVK